MRIGSTDASVGRNIQFQDPGINTHTRTNVQEGRKAASADSVNISQLSEIEKRSLPVSEKVVIEAIEKANKAISGGNRRFEFSIHEETKAIMVKVIDAETNELIREIPPEKILDIIAAIWEMAGIIVDERR